MNTILQEFTMIFCLLFLLVVTDGKITYTLHKEEETWFNADSKCRSLNSTLATPQTLSDMSLLQPHIQELKEAAWIGGFLVDDGWKWDSTNSSLYINMGCHKLTSMEHTKRKIFKSNSYQLCLKNCLSDDFPFTALSKQKCICFKSNASVQKIDDINCGYVCPGNPSEMCGGNAKNVATVFMSSDTSLQWAQSQPVDGQDCTFLRKVDDQMNLHSASCSEDKKLALCTNNQSVVWNSSLPVPWSDAIIVCGARNLSLIEIFNSEADTEYWIGLRRRSKWVWNTEKGLILLSFPVIRWSDPNNKNCICAKPSPRGTELFARRCLGTRPFVCQQDENVPGRTGSVTETTKHFTTPSTNYYRESTVLTVIGKETERTTSNQSLTSESSLGIRNSTTELPVPIWSPSKGNNSERIDKDGHKSNYDENITDTSQSVTDTTKQSTTPSAKDHKSTATTPIGKVTERTAPNQNPTSESYLGTQNPLTDLSASIWSPSKGNNSERTDKDDQENNYDENITGTTQSVTETTKLSTTPRAKYHKSTATTLISKVTEQTASNQNLTSESYLGTQNPLTDLPTSIWSPSNGNKSERTDKDIHKNNYDENGTGTTESVTETTAHSSKPSTQYYRNNTVTTVSDRVTQQTTSNQNIIIERTVDKNPMTELLVSTRAPPKGIDDGRVDQDGDEKNHVLIFIAAGGAVLLLVTVAVLIFFLLRCRRRNRYKTQGTLDVNQGNSERGFTLPSDTHLDNMEYMQASRDKSKIIKGKTPDKKHEYENQNDDVTKSNGVYEQVFDQDMGDVSTDGTESVEGHVYTKVLPVGHDARDGSDGKHQMGSGRGYSEVWTKSSGISATNGTNRAEFPPNGEGTDDSIYDKLGHFKVKDCGADCNTYSRVEIDNHVYDVPDRAGLNVRGDDNYSHIEFR